MYVRLSIRNTILVRDRIRVVVRNIYYYTYKYRKCIDVPLVWGSLRLAPIITLHGHNQLLHNHTNKPGRQEHRGSTIIGIQVPPVQYIIMVAYAIISWNPGNHKASRQAAITWPWKWSMLVLLHKWSVLALCIFFAGTYSCQNTPKHLPVNAKLLRISLSRYHRTESSNSMV